MRSENRWRQALLQGGSPNWEFPRMEIPASLPERPASQQPRRQPQPCKHYVALVRRKRIPASSKRRKMHPIVTRVKEIALFTRQIQGAAPEHCRVARASRVLVSASRGNRLFRRTADGKVRDGETPSPARETRALPSRSPG